MSLLFLKLFNGLALLTEKSPYFSAQYKRLFVLHPLLQSLTLVSSQSLSLRPLPTFYAEAMLNYPNISCYLVSLFPRIYRSFYVKCLNPPRDTSTQDFFREGSSLPINWPIWHLSPPYLPWTFCAEDRLWAAQGGEVYFFAVVALTPSTASGI